MSDPTNGDILALTAQIVSAHVSQNHFDANALPSLIQSVYRALSSAGNVGEPVAASPTPAVPIKKSVFPDYIVCLEDGKKLKMLKRHLQTSYGMTPDAYRTKWGLPRDYPMVAPTYAATRSGLAKQIGLGRKPKAAFSPAPVNPLRKPAEPASSSSATSSPSRGHNLHLIAEDSPSRSGIPPSLAPCGVARRYVSFGYGGGASFGEGREVVAFVDNQERVAAVSMPRQFQNRGTILVR